MLNTYLQATSDWATTFPGTRSTSRIIYVSKRQYVGVYVHTTVGGRTRYVGRKIRVSTISLPLDEGRDLVFVPLTIKAF